MFEYNKYMDTYNNIIREAKRLFYQNGFKGTSLRLLSQECGIRHPSLFYYFKSKEEIAFAIMKEFGIYEAQLIQDTYPEIDFDEFIMLTTLLTMQYAESDGNFYRFISESRLATVDALFESGPKQSYSAFVDLHVSIDQTTQNYLVFHAMFNLYFQIKDLIDNGKVSLGYDEMQDMILELFRRTLDIPQTRFEHIRSSSIEKASKLNIDSSFFV